MYLHSTENRLYITTVSQEHMVGVGLCWTYQAPPTSLETSTEYAAKAPYISKMMVETWEVSPSRLIMSPNSRCTERLVVVVVEERVE